MSTPNRIEWIDALRGVIILLVVMQHVETFGLQGGSMSGLSTVVMMTSMPVFMFVSGFFCHKPGKAFDFHTTKNLLDKRFRMLVPPTLFFGLLYTLTLFASRHGFGALESTKYFLLDDAKLGYWFTWVLFLIQFIYIGLSFALRKCRPKVRFTILMTLAVALYLASLMGASFYQRYAISGFLCLFNLFQFFQFFVLGALFSCYRQQLFAWLDKNSTRTCIIIAFFVCIGLWKYLVGLAVPSVMTKLALKGALELGRYAAVFMMLVLFRHYGGFFSSQNLVGRYLINAGRYSLDIYLIHYFLLPRLPQLGVWFKATPNFTLELAFVAATMVLISLCCMAIGKLIRLSPHLGYYLLGDKSMKR